MADSGFGYDAITHVFVSIVAVSIVFHLICLVRFCDCRGGAEVDCGCDCPHAVDHGMFAEEMGFFGCRAGCGHVVAFVYFSVG